MEQNLSGPKRKKIFQQFLYNKKLRFNEIEKLTGIRSNDLAYFIQKLLEDGVLVKSDEAYSLSEQAEKYIPFFVKSDEELSPLPVVLVACVNDGKVILHKRKKRPYEGYWGLPGGRVHIGETIEQASIRILKKVTFLDGKFISANSVINEKHEEEGKIKHAFLIISVKMEPASTIKEKEDIKWHSIKELPDKTIPSDRWIIEKKLDTKIEIKDETIVNKDSNLNMDDNI